MSAASSTTPTSNSDSAMVPTATSWMSGSRGDAVEGALAASARTHALADHCDHLGAQPAPRRCRRATRGSRSLRSPRRGAAGRAAGRSTSSSSPSTSRAQRQPCVDAEVDDVRIVRGDEQRRAALVDRLEQLEQLDARAPDRGCRSARRRAGSPARRRWRGPRRRAAARRPTAMPRAASQRVAEADGLERGGGAHPDVARGQPEDLERHADVLERRAIAEQLEVLEDDADVAPHVGDRGVRQFAEVAPGNRQLAAVGALGGEHQAQQRRLARARRAGEQQRVALTDAERDTAQRRHAAEGLPDPVQSNHRAHASPWLRSSGSSCPTTATMHRSPVANFRSILFQMVTSSYNFVIAM